MTELEKLRDVIVNAEIAIKKAREAIDKALEVRGLKPDRNSDESQALR